MRNMVERPFAYCCAEAGGHVEACDCINKNHGTAWFSTPTQPLNAGIEQLSEGEREDVARLIYSWTPCFHEARTAELQATCSGAFSPATWDEVTESIRDEVRVRAAAVLALIRPSARDGECERDAARWRALWSSDRIRMMGCAGFDFADDGTVKLRAKGGQHMGVEVWDKHPAQGDGEDSRGRKVLLAYVDARAALSADRSDQVAS